MSDQQSNWLGARAMALVLAGLALFPTAAFAEEAPEPLPTGDDPRTIGQRDRLTVSPYLWGPDIAGTVSIGPLEAPVDLSLSDLASGLKIAGMGHIQYNSGPVFAYIEGIGAKFGDPQFASFANQPVAASAVMIETGMGTAIDVDLRDERQLRIAPYAGVRYVRLKAAVNGPLLVLSGENDWVDPVAGAIVELELSDRWSLVGKADLAGLSIADNSYWSGALAIQYRASEKLALLAGYRSAEGSFRADAGLSADLEADGPVFGLRYMIGNNDS